MPLRIKLAIFFLIIFLVVLVSRVYHISIKSNDYYNHIAKQNVVKTEYIAPTRGIIYDKNDNALAINNMGFAIFAKPHMRKKLNKKLLKEDFDYISSLLDLNATKLQKTYAKRDSLYNHELVKVVDFIEYDKAFPIYTKLSLRPFIQIKPTFVRQYPNKQIASHILGYISKANTEDIKKNKVTQITSIVGKSGLEKQYNDVLAGTVGVVKTKVTAKNETIEVLEKIPSKSKDIYLHLDLQLQKYITKVFQDLNYDGAAIVMDVNSGAILAAGSFPQFDINKFVKGISHKEWNELNNNLKHPFTNKITKGLYPPGSVIKMGVGLSFLESDKITPKTTFDCGGTFFLGKYKRKFRCWKHKGHGKTSFKKAIRESCDDYFYKGSLEVGIKNISSKLKKLGFGEKTGIDLPSEFIGTVPSRQWKLLKYGQPWYQGETLITSIGQGYSLTTPLQVARHTALLATGKLPTPQLVRKVGTKKIKPNLKNALNKSDKKYLSLIQRAMFEVCNHPKGTAKRYIKTNVTLACKTGTAQVVGIPQKEKKRMKESELKYYQRSHAWLTTYAPFKNPKYAVTVLVEHGGHGGEAAGPVVSKIYDYLQKNGYL
jgi:penicillin-binding protein 2